MVSHIISAYYDPFYNEAKAWCNSVQVYAPYHAGAAGGPACIEDCRRRFWGNNQQVHISSASVTITFNADSSWFTFCELRVEKDGSDFVFPEAFQLDVNDAEYINNNLQVHSHYSFVLLRQRN